MGQSERMDLSQGKLPRHLDITVCKWFPSREMIDPNIDFVYLKVAYLAYMYDMYIKFNARNIHVSRDNIRQNKRMVLMRIQFWISMVVSLCVMVLCLGRQELNSVESSGESVETLGESINLRNPLGESMLIIQIDDSLSGGSSLELNINGQKTVLNVKSMQSADDAIWLNRKLAKIVPFKAQTSYKNFDDDATAVINSLGKGLNVGQSWDAMPTKDFMPGAYRNIFTTRELFRRIKKAGFDHVRIPVNFSNKTAIVAPWTIDPEYLDRFFDNVDDALAEGLLVIVDNHHHWGFLNKSRGDKSLGGSLPRSEQLIRQAAMVAHVAKRLNEYPFEKVLFELENEPNGRFNKDWNDYWPDMLKGCRAVNPKTIFLIGGTKYNSHTTLKLMPEITDRRTCLVAHIYSPHPFTHNNHRGKRTALWSDSGYKEMNNAFDIVVKQVALRGKPCVITEIGVAGNITNHHRNMYARDATNACMSRGMPLTYWNAYGDFGIFHPAGFFTEGITEAITGIEKASDYAMPHAPGSNAIALNKGLYGAHKWPLTDPRNKVIASNETPELEFTDTTITVVSDPVHKSLILPYVLMKDGISDAPRDGRRFRFTVGSTNSESRFKLTLTDMHALVDVQGYIPFPKGASASSNPKWGDHSSGIYEYECYSVTNKDHLKHSAPLAFIFSASNIERGDVITFKIEWLD